MSSLKKFLALSLIITMGYFSASLFSKKEDPEKKLASHPKQKQLHILRSNEVPLQVQSTAQPPQTEPPKVIVAPVIRKAAIEDEVESFPIRVAQKPLDAPSNPLSQSQPLIPNVLRQPKKSRLQMPLELTQLPQPLEETSRAADVQSAQTHTIVDGDTLWGIAEKYLGSRDLDQTIFRANLDKLTSPDLLPIGMTITIPTPSQAAGSAEFGLGQG